MTARPRPQHRLPRPRRHARPRHPAGVWPCSGRLTPQAARSAVGCARPGAAPGPGAGPGLAGATRGRL